MRLGIVGGTFDPVHLGHVAMAEAAAECASLDRVLLIPAGLPPHRSAAIAPAPDRLEMCRLAVAAHPRLMVCDIELRRPGASYTVDTLLALAAARPGDELHLVLGWDAAREIASWHEPEAVLRLARLVVVTRPGYATPHASDLVAAGVPVDRCLLCDQPTPDIVATDIRRRARRGESLAGLVDPAVESYLRTRHLYEHRED